MPSWMQAAWSTLVAMRTAHRGPLIALWLPFLIGAVAAALIMPLLDGADPTAVMGIMGALVAFGGLLVGFVVTLMLFTGHSIDFETLTYEQVDAYTHRIKYLLVSQAVTLLAALMLAVLAVVWMTLYAVGAPLAAMCGVGAVLGGFGVLCLVRMVWLPVQVFELHEAGLEGARKRAEQRTNERYRH